MLDWIATVLLALFAGLAFWTTEGAWPAPVAIACLVLATAAMFPPLWRRRTGSRWHAARRLIAAGLTAIALFMPIETHTVKFDMPQPSSQR